MKKVARVYRMLEQNIGIVILVAIFIDVLLQILTRILPGQALSWSMEAAEILMGALIWFGLPLAIREVGLVKLEFLVNLFSPKARKVLFSLGNLVLVIYLIFMCVFTSDLLKSYLQLGTKTSMLQINYFYIRLPVLIGSILAIIRVVLVELYKYFPRLDPLRDDDLQEGDV